MKFKKLSVFIMAFVLLFSTMSSHSVVNAADSYSIPYIILSQYYGTMKIGEGIYIGAYTSTGKKPTWKSSNSSVASVNTYGYVTAKNAGTAVITAKIKDAEASCKITVKKTTITLNKTNVTLEHGQWTKLVASVSSGAKVKWKSSKKSIATIDEYGTVIALKPGETIITATADKTSVTCKVKVKSPDVTLNSRSVKLYRTQTFSLTASVSSNIKPIWRSNRKSVATVDENGKITAIKHGTAIITAKADDVSVTCEVTVKQPDVTLNKNELSLKTGEKETLTAKVSSGNTPVWSCSNSDVIIVSDKGVVTAKRKGTAYVYVKEDGVTSKCKVKVTE